MQDQGLTVVLQGIGRQQPNILVRCMCLTIEVIEGLDSHAAPENLRWVAWKECEFISLH